MRLLDLVVIRLSLTMSILGCGGILYLIILGHKWQLIFLELSGFQAVWMESLTLAQTWEFVRVLFV